MSTKPYDIVDVLEDPEAAFPGNFSNAKRANALLLCLCQDAADEIRRLRKSEPVQDELPAEILNRPATRRELPAYMRSVPGVVVTPGPGVDIDAVHLRGARAQ